MQDRQSGAVNISVFGPFARVMGDFIAPPLICFLDSAELCVLSLLINRGRYFQVQRETNYSIPWPLSSVKQQNF